MEKFTCPFCGTEFLTKVYLMEHLTTCKFQYGEPKLAIKTLEIKEPFVEKPVEKKKVIIKKRG